MHLSCDTLYWTFLVVQLPAVLRASASTSLIVYHTAQIACNFFFTLEQA